MNMKRLWLDRALLIVASVAVAGIGVVSAQTPTPMPQPSAKAEKPVAERTVVALKVQLTISQYDGEKKTGSLPFTLWVNANDAETTLQTGIQVPMIVKNSSGQAPAEFTYRAIGTNITCRATSADDGRFRLNLIINDNSIVPAKTAGANPTFQSFTAQNNLYLRDGQNAQFVAATDKLTGEVTRVDVTVTVLK